MPSIEEYLPQTEAQGAVGGVSPNIELAGAAGRGLEQLGADIGVGADLIHRRNAQEEQANVFADIAGKRAQFFNQIHQQTQDGTLDVNKLKDQFDDETGKLADGLNTPEGRNYFERQQARLRGQVLQMAASGQATLAAADARSKYQDGITKTSASIMQAPQTFDDAHDAGLELVDSLIKDGGLPEKFRGKLVSEMGAEYSKAAIRGWADMDFVPQKDGSSVSGPDFARQLLKTGAFDDYLDSDKKKQMLGEIDHTETANRIEKTRQQKSIRDAQTEQDNQYIDKIYAGLNNGTYSATQVIKDEQSGLVSAAGSNRALHLMDAANKRSEFNPRLYNDLSARIGSKDITRADQLEKYLGKGLDPTHFTALTSILKKENAPFIAQENSLFKSAASVIRFKNPLNGSQWDTQGETNLAQFKQDYLAEKQKYIKQGKDPADLLDPKNGDSFWNKMHNYHLDWHDQFQQIKQERTDKALGLKPDDQGNVNPVPDARRPGESPADYLKRMKK